jgi:hypothetical protein
MTLFEEGAEDLVWEEVGAEDEASIWLAFCAVELLELDPAEEGVTLRDRA